MSSGSRHSNAISATDVFSYVDYLLCSVAHPCSVESTTGFVTYFVPNGGDPLYLSDGTFHETAIYSSATPEPSSFVLLGTGVLGTFGAVRRRLRRA